MKNPHELEYIEKILAWQIAQALGHENEETLKEHCALFLVDWEIDRCFPLMIGKKYRQNVLRENWDEPVEWANLVIAMREHFVREEYSEAVEVFMSERGARKKFKKRRCFDSCEYLATFRTVDAAGEPVEEVKWVHCVEYVFRDEENRHLMSCFWLAEIDAYQRNMNALHYIAQHDQLTGLYNRHMMTELLPEGKAAIFIILDINDFKSINDHYGHMAGDEALRTVANSLEVVFHQRAKEFIFRLGGDEFLVVLTETDEQRAIACMKTLTEPILTGDGITIGLSMGYSVCPGTNYREYMKAADDALYYVKENGKIGYWKKQPED